MSKLRSKFHKHIENYKNYNNHDFNTSSSSSNNNIGLNRRRENVRGDKAFGFSKIDRRDRSIICHECDGFGHYQAECATFLKRKKKKKFNSHLV